MWNVESYKVEIRNTSSCDADDNIVVSNKYDASQLEPGHNPVNITGLCPSMQYWYCTSTVWVYIVGGQEISRKTVVGTGTFITADVDDRSADWDVPGGVCSGHPDKCTGQNGRGGILSWTLSNIPVVDGVPDLPSALRIQDLVVSIDSMNTRTTIRNDLGVSEMNWVFTGEQDVPCKPDITSADSDYVIVYGD